MKLGDRVKSVTNLLGIPQCGGCKTRQAWLNELGAKFDKKEEVDHGNEGPGGQSPGVGTG